MYYEVKNVNNNNNQVDLIWDHCFGPQSSTARYRPRLSLAIIAVGVDHLSRSSCHLGFPNFIALMRRPRS
jgi:hypothetical protein